MTRRGFFSWLLCVFGFHLHLHEEWYGETETTRLPDGLGTVSKTTWVSKCSRPGCDYEDHYRPKDH